MMGATLQSLAIIGGAALVSGILSRWIAKTITLSPATQRNYPELQKRLNGWISRLAEGGAHSHRLCRHHAAVERLGPV